MLKVLKYLGAGLLVLLVLLLATVYLRYGGGRTYPYTVAPPLLTPADLEVYFSGDEPIGNVAATNDTTQPQRVFITIHPESRPTGAKLLEITGGQSRPYPDAAFQARLNTPLGVYCDRQNRLWVIDHGNHGTESARLTAFDLRSNTVALEYAFPETVAEKGSFFNDLSVTPDGRYVVVADVSFWRKQPSLVIFDTQTGRSKSWLDGHPSIQNEGYVPVTPAKKMRFFGGLADLMPGIDGLDVSPDGRYVYYAAMSHSGLFRIPVSALTNFDADPTAVAAQVERVADKPLSDGIRLDAQGTTYITDIEHQGIAVVTATGERRTLIQDPRIRWADGLSFAADGYCYLADSDIPDQMLQSKEHIQQHKPYFVFRFKPSF